MVTLRHSRKPSPVIRGGTRSWIRDKRYRSLSGPGVGRSSAEPAWL